MTDLILIDEAGNYVDISYKSTDALLIGKYSNQFSLFNEARHTALLSMYRIDTIPVSIEKINVSITNFVPGAEKKTETMLNKYTVGTNITFNLTFSREVYIKTLSNDADIPLLKIKIGNESKHAKLIGYENNNNKKIVSFVYSIIQNDVGDNIFVLIGNNKLTDLDGVQIGDNNVYTGGVITSIGNIDVSKNTPNNIYYIPYDNTIPKTEILQNEGIIPYKIDTIKPKIDSVTITSDKTIYNY